MQQPQQGFFSDSVGVLLRKSLTRSQLLMAWDRVRSNQGMAGVDQVSTDDYGHNLQAKLDALRQQVLAGQYATQPYLRVTLPRPGRQPRLLSVPTVQDRVLQTSVAMVLMPLFEAEFENCSFAYRQGRSVRQAVARIEQLQHEGYRWVVDADIEAFFDHIPHTPLLKVVSQVVAHDPSVTTLVKHWLSTPVQAGGHQHQTRIGVPQGLPISPMLSNLYLDHLDEALLHEDLALVRYADDFVILTRTEQQAQAALALTKQTLSQLQLRLNDHKTRIVHLDHGLEFLGWTFVRSLAVPRGQHLSDATETAHVSGQPQASGHTVSSPNQDMTPANAPVANEPPSDEGPENDQNSDTPLPPADAMQRTLYVLEPGAELGKEGERLILRKADQVLLEIPVMHVDQVILFGQHAISAAAMHLCMKQGVAVVLLSRLGRFVGRLDSKPGAHVRLLLAQVRAMDQPDFGLALAAQFVAAKLSHSALVLSRYARHRTLQGNAASDIHEAVLRLREDARRVKTADSLDRLRGLEGQAARIYFAAMRTMLPSEWGFTARQKQPPPDPINAMLSLGYTLLYHSVAGLLQARGLNAYLGFLHAPGGDHFALASDVMEEFRPVVVDSLVLDWCLNHTIQPSDFKITEEGCTLSTELTRKFIHAFEEKLGFGSQWIWPGQTQGADLRRRIDWQAMRLTQALHAQDASLYTASPYR